MHDPRLPSVLRRTLLLFAVAFPLQAQSNGLQPRTTASGVFTDDQAARGETVFQSYCASCHASDFHTGDQFRLSWFGRTVYDYFKIVKTTMPEDDPGGLSDDDYARVIAYIFQLNGFPAGKDSLATDSLELKAIRIGPAATDGGQRKNR